MSPLKDNLSKKTVTYSNKVLIFDLKEIKSFFNLICNFYKNSVIEVSFTDREEKTFSSTKDLDEYIETNNPWTLF